MKSTREDIESYSTAELISLRDRLQSDSSLDATSLYNALLNIGARLASKNEYDQAINCFIKVYLIINMLPNKVDLPMTYFFMGKINYAKGDIKQALAFFTQATSLIQCANNQEYFRHLLARIQSQVGDIYMMIGEYKQADREYRNAVTIFSALKDQVSTQEVYHSLSKINFLQGNLKEALVYLNKALSIQTPSTIARTIEMLFDKGSIYNSMNQDALAIEWYEKSLALAKTNPTSMNTMIHTALAQLYEGEASAKHFMAALHLMKMEAKENDFRYVTLFVAMMSKDIPWENDSAEMYKLADVALANAKKACGDKHYMTASVHAYRADMFAKEYNFYETINSNLEAIKIYENMDAYKHHKLCIQARYHLAQIYLNLARTLSGDDIVFYYDLAHKQLLKAYASNLKVIENNEQSIAPDILLQHDKILGSLTEVYRSRAAFKAAGKLFAEQAMQFQRFPTICLYYIEQAIGFYKCCEDGNTELKNLYELRAHTCYSAGQHRYAIKSLMKAYNLDPANKELKATLDKWQANEEQELNYLDEDIYIQLERCADLYQEFQLSNLIQITNRSTLTEFSKNLSTEIIIKLRNILDIAYQRMSKALIYKDKDAPELYYPCASSEKSLRKELAPNIKETPTITKDDLKITPANPINEIYTALIEHGYIDKSGNLTDLFDKDPNLSKLDSRYDIHRKKITDKLNEEKQNKKPILKATLGKAGLSLPPPPGDIFDILKTLKLLHKEVKPGVCELNMDIINKEFLTAFKAKLLEKDDKKKGYSDFAETIIDIIKNKVANQNAIPLDHPDYKKVYDALIQSQPFYYHRDSENLTQSKWQTSWLDKIHAISNDSKHTRLTPQGVSSHIRKQTGITTEEDVKVYIHYSETRFYSWSFLIPIFQVNPNMPYEAAGQLSRDIIDALRKGGYIDKPKEDAIKGKKAKWDVVSHAIADEIWKVSKELTIEQRKIPKNIEAIDKKEKELDGIIAKFLTALEKDLPKNAKPYAQGILNLLTRRLLQRGHIQLMPDQLVDIDELLTTSMRETRHLARVFGEACLKLNPPSQEKLLSVIASKKIAMLTVDELTILLEKKFAEIDSNSVITPTLLGQFNNTLKSYVKLCLYHNESGQAAKTLLQAAELMHEKNLISVAFMYYKKVLFYLTLNYNDFSIAYEEVLKDYINLCWKYGLNEAALKAGVKLLKISSEPMLADHFVTNHLKRHISRLEKIDKDIYSQFHHAKARYHELLYLSLKLGNNPGDRYLVATIQNGVAELIIKMRQLIDQCFCRLVKATVYWPREIEETDIHLPCSASIDTLKDELEKRDILLSKEAFEILANTQPTKTGDNHWLVRLINLSNQLKHVRLTLPTDAELRKRWLQAKSLEEFYPINCRKGMPWERDVKDREDISAFVFLKTVLDQAEELMHGFYRVIARDAPAHLGLAPDISRLVERKLLNTIFEGNDLTVVPLTSQIQEEKKRGGSGLFESKSKVDLPDKPITLPKP